MEEPFHWWREFQIAGQEEFEVKSRKNNAISRIRGEDETLTELKRDNVMSAVGSRYTETGDSANLLKLRELFLIIGHFPMDPASRIHVALLFFSD